MNKKIWKLMYTQGCVVWWSRLEVGSARKELEEHQRLLFVCVTGAMRSTVTHIG